MKQMNGKTTEFIKAHINENVHQLALQAAKYPDLDIPFVVRQINGLQKVKQKIPLFYNTADILFPAQLSLEQSSSESTAKYKSSLCEGNLLIDLTGGFGIDCCFMSENFVEAIYVERNAELCEIATHNYAALQKSQIKVINEQSEDFLFKFPQKADWIYIDPARRSKSGKKVVLLEDCEPNVITLNAMLNEKAENVMIKLSPMIDINAAIQSLCHITAIHIISVDNECKEIVLIQNSAKTSEIKVFTLNITKGGKNENFDFILCQESEAQATMSDHVHTYLYEPNSAVLKAGAFKLLSEKLQIHKLHKNSHLYCSDEFLPHFPGRKFKVQKVWESNKNELKTLAQTHPKANIATRNYPLTVDELRKKLKINDGGDTYLFATTLASEKKVIIECTKAID